MLKKFEQYRKTLKRRHIYGHPLVWWQRLYNVERLKRGESQNFFGNDAAVADWR
jgi:hypothetical protein